MTTNVYHRPEMVATDSRWSADAPGNVVIWVDDTGFEKIELLDDRAAFMFAGAGSRIQEWKDYVRGGPVSLENRPSTFGIAVCIVDLRDGEVILVGGSCQQLSCGSCFAGSGTPFAVSHWQVNQDARQAVEFAKTGDIYTGGTVSFFDIKTREHNLVRDRDVKISHVAEMIYQEALKMIDDASKAGPAAAVNDSEFRDFAAKVASGEISPCAPFEGMDQPMSAEHESKLNQALRKVFDMK